MTADADDHTHDDNQWEMMMPFVACRTHGGPYDDAAYVAGWEMGALSERLSMMRHLGSIPPPWMTIHRANLPQLDLVVMPLGLMVHEVDHDELVEWGLEHELTHDDTWAVVQLRPLDPVSPLDE